MLGLARREAPPSLARAPVDAGHEALFEAAHQIRPLATPSKTRTASSQSKSRRWPFSARNRRASTYAVRLLPSMNPWFSARPLA